MESFVFFILIGILRIVNLWYYIIMYYIIHFIYINYIYYLMY